MASLLKSTFISQCVKLVGRASARRLSSTGGSNRCVPPPVKDPCGASSPPVCPPPKSQGICPDPAALGIMCADYVPCVPWGTHWARLSRRKNMELVFGVTCLVVAIIAVMIQDPITISRDPRRGSDD